MPTAAQIEKWREYASIAREHGIHNSFTAIVEGDRVSPKIGAALAVAMLEQESKGKNVWGHDPTIFIGGWDARNQKYWTTDPRRRGYVNEAGYREYKRQRGTTRMQGVGPMQLTWWSTQDKADRYGGCWLPKYNIRVGFELLSDNIQAHGLHEGIKRYNGSGPRAEAYADAVMAKRAEWRRRFGIR